MLDVMTWPWWAWVLWFAVGTPITFFALLLLVQARPARRRGDPR
jgi:hypothetical protein